MELWKVLKIFARGTGHAEKTLRRQEIFQEIIKKTITGLDQQKCILLGMLKVADNQKFYPANEAEAKRWAEDFKDEIVDFSAGALAMGVHKDCDFKGIFE